MADYTCEVDEAQYNVDRAQKAMAAAMNAYSKGTGSVTDVNRCERRLADAHQHKYRISAGLASDVR
jgi:hypothetical protein